MERRRFHPLYGYEIFETETHREFDRLTRIGSALFHAPICAVTLLQDYLIRYTPLNGIEVNDTPREQIFCMHAVRKRDRPLIVPDTTKDPRFAGNAYVVGEPHVRFYAGVPLISNEGEPLGALCFVDYFSRPSGLSERELELLQDLAMVTMSLIELHLERKILKDTERRLYRSHTELADQLRQRDETLAHFATHHLE